jgi:hypothetical protein
MVKSAIAVDLEGQPIAPHTLQRVGLPSTHSLESLPPGSRELMFSLASGKPDLERRMDQLASDPSFKALSEPSQQAAITSMWLAGDAKNGGAQDAIGAAIDSDGFSLLLSKEQGSLLAQLSAMSPKSAARFTQTLAEGGNAQTQRDWFRGLLAGRRDGI